MLHHPLGKNNVKSSASGSPWYAESASSIHPGQHDIDGAGLFAHCDFLDTSKSITIVENDITNNVAGSTGAGHYLYDVAAEIRGNEFSGNGANEASAISLFASTTAILYDNKFTSNSATGSDTAAVHKYQDATSLDGNNTPLTDPDGANEYSSNTPRDILLE